MLDFDPSRLADLVIVITLIEAAVLAVWHRVRRTGPAPREWLPTLLSGLFLMLALRAALQGSDWTTWAAWLAAAGLAHVADMLGRWKRIRPS